MVNTEYSEFSDPRLVAIYNTTNPISGYQQFYLDLALDLSAKTIIDVGCGSGLLTCKLAKQAHSIIGIEPAKAMLDLARISGCGKDVIWIEGDALKLEAYNADLAIMTGHVAQFHLTDDYWTNALKSIYNALRPGGFLSFESRNPDIQSWIKTWPSKVSPRSVVDSSAGVVKWWIQLLEIKDAVVRYEIHYLFIMSGEELVSLNTLRFRTKDELTQSLIRTGFKIDHIYGDWDKSEVTEESPEFIFVAQKLT